MRLTGRRCAAVVLVALLGLVGCSIQPGLAVTLQAPSNGGSVSSLTPILSWEASGSPASYRLQVASDSGFQDLVLDQTLSGPSYTVPSGKLKDSQSYYWRVSASRGTDTSGWTPYWVFQTRVSTDTITVSATLDGSPWSGTVNYSLTGPKSGSSSSVPETFSDLETGSYTLSYASGGPPGARLARSAPWRAPVGASTVGRARRSTPLLPPLP